MKPKHIVMCTGHAGEAYIPKFPGHELFEGAVYHGSQHKDATFQDNIAGKKVVVVGTGNSGHDIAQNYHETGASATAEGHIRNLRQTRPFHAARGHVR